MHRYKTTTTALLVMVLFSANAQQQSHTASIPEQTVINASASIPLYNSAEQKSGSANTLQPILRTRLYQPPQQQIQQIPMRWHGIAPKTMLMQLPDHPLVAKFLKQYDTPEGKKWLSAVIKRAYPYRAFIEQKIREYNMPPEIVYLPVIESSYVITARSKSGALGIWQFMKNSIAPFGICSTEWMDERYDPWKMTDAALRKLQENKNILGSWELALAAYNCGLGAVRKAIKKANSSDYWYLADHNYLPTQTKNYVPKFLAISHLLSCSGRYQIDTGWNQPAEKMESIQIKRAVDLTVLADECKIPATILTKANPALLYNITPPDTICTLNIPTKYLETVQSVLENSKRLLVKYYIYKIKSGDTFFALARHYEISVAMLEQYNPQLKPAALKIGAKVVIPAFKEISPYSGKKRTENLAFNGTYTVKKGDTLWSIALAFDVQVETLAEENKMGTNDILSTGKRLRVPILQ